MYSAQSASVKLNLCFCEIFHSLIGQLDLQGNLVHLCFLEFLVYQSLSWLFAEHLMVPWVTEVFNLRFLAGLNVYCALENLFGLANVTVNAGKTKNRHALMFLCLKRHFVLYSCLLQ